jgi:hypothetical protein
MPFCREHHDQFHALLRTAGVNLEYTSDPRERLVRGVQACLVAQWMLTKALQELNSRRDMEGTGSDSHEHGGAHV